MPIQAGTTSTWRCSDGHVYTASRGQTTFLAIHLGSNRHFQRCPIDGRWRMAERIDPSELTEHEGHQAEANSVQ